MIRCPKCNEELEDDAVFCSGCGAAIEQTIFCPQCGQKTSKDSDFCQNCGAPINHMPEMKAPTQAAASGAAYTAVAAAAPAMGQPAAVQQATGSKGFKLNPKVIAAVGGVAVVAVVVIVAALLLGNRKSGDNYALYIKDEEIMYSNLKKNSESWQVTSRLVDTDDIENYGLASETSTLGYYTCITDDGKYIFFIDKIDTSDDGVNLYYRRLGKDDEAIKIDSDVSAYTVSDSGKLVTYYKDENVYQYSLSADSKEKIASEVYNFIVSDDGSELYYLTEDYDLYWVSGDEKEKLASEISDWLATDEDYEQVYYIKDDTLYRQSAGEEREKIDSDVNRVIKVYDSGEIYYVKNATDGTTGTLMDYVTDDMKGTDASITEPTYPSIPNSPSWWDYDTTAQYEAAYDAWKTQRQQLLDEYNTAYDEYYAKLDRDYLREELEETEATQTFYTLCYYDGSEEKVITDAFSWGTYRTANDEAVMIYEACDTSDIEKVNLSEITSVYDVEYMLDDLYSDSSEYYVAVKDVSSEIKQEKVAGTFRISNDGTVIYYIDDIPDDKNYGDLYKIEIKKGTVGSAEVYDSDVYTGSISFLGDTTKVSYYKDYDTSDGEGELYVDKEKVDYDVYSRFYDSDQDVLYYYTDWNEEKEYGTLNVFRDGEKEKIADDIYTYSSLDDGRVLYLTDYSLNYYKGDLMIWDDGKTRKIDEDVVGIIPIYDSENRNWWN